MDYFVICKVDGSEYYTGASDLPWHADRARAERFTSLEQCLELLWKVRPAGGPRAYEVVMINAVSGVRTQVWPAATKE